MQPPQPPGPPLGLRLFVPLFLLIQIALPARVLLFEENWHSSGGYMPEFSWNMYARTQRFVFRYRLHTPDGKRERISHQEGLGRTQLVRVVHPSRLLAYHEWLCMTLRLAGRVGPVTADVRTVGSDDIERVLVRPGVDICRAENFGVVEG